MEETKTKCLDNQGAANTAGEKDELPSFSDKIYDAINSVIGGTNSMQFLQIGLPGTLIDASQYSYDVDKGEPKPPHVKANESKLVDKLFDACTMTASDNGRRLSSQYKSALNILTPKLNGKLFEAKCKLRNSLMTPYPYNFGDGKTETLTLEQVFYKLYAEYVEAKRRWSQMQLDKRNELKERYPNDTEADYKKRDDEYLEWYAITAEAEELAVEQKLGQVLNIFSPGDMEIINAILDSGAGREIAEARMTLANAGEPSPDGGTVYPVTLYPENWFTLLDTSFNAVDLLESPAAIAESLSVLEAERANITTNIDSFLSVIPDEADVAKLREASEACGQAFNAALQKLIGNNINATIGTLKTLTDILAAKKSDDPKSVPQDTVARIFGVDIEKVTSILDALGNSMTECLDKQSSLVEAAEKATTSAEKYFAANNMLQLKTMLAPLKAQLESTNAQIEATKEKLRIALAVSSRKTETTGKDESEVAPNSVPNNFTQIIITSSMKEANKSSSTHSSASASSYGVSFFFGGYSSNSSHKDAVSKAFNENSEMKIQIGMAVAKVKIGREWFNPGLFMLTSDMYNTSSAPIAPKRSSDVFDKKRFDEMNASLFPCFPTAFIVARDVTIKFSTSKAMSSSFAKSVEDHASSGGGFFIFGGSRSSSSSSSESAAKATSNANSVTVRFTNPQIIGYYLEATPADMSTSISADVQKNSDFISIFKFIEAFQTMLDDNAKKHNKK